MPFSRSHFEKRVTDAVLPEDLQDITLLIFHEMAMWRSQTREEQTRFEHLTDYQLHQAMYQTLNQMVTRMYQQDQHQTLVCIFLPLHVPDDAQYRSVTCSITRGCQKVLRNLVIVNICTNISSEWQTWPVYFKSESSLPNAS